MYVILNTQLGENDNLGTLVLNTDSIQCVAIYDTEEEGKFANLAIGDTFYRIDYEEAKKLINFLNPTRLHF